MWLSFDPLPSTLPTYYESKQGFCVPVGEKKKKLVISLFKIVCLSFYFIFYYEKSTEN